MRNIFRDRPLLRRDCGSRSRLEASGDAPSVPPPLLVLILSAGEVTPFPSPHRTARSAVSSHVRSSRRAKTRPCREGRGGWAGDGGTGGTAEGRIVGRRDCLERLSCHRRRHVVMRFVTIATANRRGKSRSPSRLAPLPPPSLYLSLSCYHRVPRRRSLVVLIAADRSPRGVFLAITGQPDNERPVPQRRCLFLSFFLSFFVSPILFYSALLSPAVSSLPPPRPPPSAASRQGSSLAKTAGDQRRPAIHDRI